MIDVEFEQPDGSVQRAHGREGESVMKTATNALVPGIVADCGGELSCATCHVFVAPQWSAAVGPPSEFEDEMLDATSEERQESSRLSCQIALRPDLHGLRVTVPRTQW